MRKHGAVSTETEPKPLVFTLIALIGSAAASVLLFAFGGGTGLAVFAGIGTAIVAAAAGLILFAMLTDYAYVEGNVLVTRYLFRKNRIPLEKIGKVTCRENVYYVYGRSENLLGTVNGLLKGIDSILGALESNGVHFE